MQSLLLRQLSNLIVLFILASLLPIAAATAAPRQHGTQPYADAALIVRLRPGVLTRQLAVKHRLHLDPEQFRLVDDLPIYRFRLIDHVNPADKALELMSDPRVIYAEPDYFVAAPEASQRSSWAVGEADAPAEAEESAPDEATSADPQAAQRSSWAVGDEHGDPELAYASQWALAATELPAAHARSQGVGVIVAILDTGVDPTHPVLAGRLMAGYDFIDNDADPSELTTDPEGRSYGHGTHVAGLIALAAPEATIMPLRTLDANGVGTIWGQAQAIWYAAHAGADVINLSWSMPQSSRLIDDLLGLAACRSVLLPSCTDSDKPGAVIVAAAGNSGDKTPQYPGSSRVPGLLTVAASNAEGQIADFSTFGPWVSLAAPGDQIISTIPGGGYASWSGTSMATPIAAGTVALLRASYPQLLPVVAVKRLVVSATTRPGSVRRHLNAPAALVPRN
ncbi:MAG: S8 family serine peptidase [Oscillochloridaceae bacterium umkhey_bin13]